MLNRRLLERWCVSVLGSLQGGACRHKIKILNNLCMECLECLKVENWVGDGESVMEGCEMMKSFEDDMVFEEASKKSMPDREKRRILP